METTMNENKKLQEVISSSDFLNHWQGHRNLTRKVIDVFPEDAFFNHTIGGMRTFSAMIMELLGIAGPGIKEIATGKTVTLNEHMEHNNSKENVLKMWDNATDEINEYWNQINLEDFQNKITLFGQYEGTVTSSILYFIDNEIHHRGQGYVYLRSLGIEPPMFWER